jgi:hypothetical protein
MSAATCGVAVAVSASTVGVAQRAHGLAERHERGPEIVPPLRDAMRFVHDEERDLGLLERREEFRVREALGRGEDDLGLALLHVLDRFAFLRGAQGAVDRLGFDADLLELVGLVLHQRDERRDHHRGAVEMHGGKLVAERLAGARRHDRQHVAPRENAFDHVALARAQRFEAKLVPQGAAKRALHGCRDRQPRRAAVQEGSAMERAPRYRFARLAAKALPGGRPQA